MPVPNIVEDGISHVIEAVQVIFVDSADAPIKHKHADRKIVMCNAADSGGDAR